MLHTKDFHATVALPPKMLPVFGVPRGGVMYRWFKGGRGSGKSFNCAKMAAIWGTIESLRILCVREFQASIKESFYAELKAAIQSEPWLAGQYDVGVDYIRHKWNGTEFIFRGLRRNIGSIKSMAKIDLTIIEEAEDVPEEAWLALEATVFRQFKSEIWVIWNPRLEGSPVDERFVKNPPALDYAIGVEINWSDNPFFPDNMKVLRLREQSRLDPDTYAHVWEGGYLTNSNKQVYGGKWKISEFDVSPDWAGPYQGGDFGFAQDPLAAIRCHVDDVENVLYISREAGRIQLDIDATPAYLTERIPAFGAFVTRWDSARPESISYLRRHGLPRTDGVEKWKGSVEDGIAFIRQFKRIVVHPRCVETIKELRLYSYKTDRITGDILPDVVDAFNHYMDALRYALAPMIKMQGAAGMLFSSRRS